MNRLVQVRRKSGVVQKLSLPVLLFLLAACLAVAQSGFAWCADAPAPVSVGAKSPDGPENASESKEDKKKKKKKKKKGGSGSRFKDPEDGKFDLTAGADQGAGFTPIVLPFNDPALGAGLALAIAYFHPQENPPVQPSGAAAPPTATFGAVAGTTNGSWAAAVGHHHVWGQDKTRYLGAVGGGSVNLTFYGFGDEGTSGDEGIDFNIDVLGTVQQVKFRIGRSSVFVGARYVFAGTNTTFDSTVAGVVTGETDLAGITALAEYDNRDTVFTPSRGLRASLNATWFAEALGGDFNYGSVTTEFYALSFVQLRGVPIFRYIGNYVVTFEVEPRYKIDGRWSVLAFAGAGRAAKSFSNLSNADRACGFGTGFRYLLARKLGLGGRDRYRTRTRRFGRLSHRWEFLVRRFRLGRERLGRAVADHRN